MAAERNFLNLEILPVATPRSAVTRSTSQKPLKHLTYLTGYPVVQSHSGNSILLSCLPDGQAVFFHFTQSFKKRFFSVFHFSWLNLTWHFDAQLPKFQRNLRKHSNSNETGQAKEIIQ